MTATVRRITISLPADLADDLDYVHRRVGVSKSAFVSSLLAEGVNDLRVLLETLPEDPTPEDVVRFRGSSISLVEDRVTRYLDELEGGS